MAYASILSVAPKKIISGCKNNLTIIAIITPHIIRVLAAVPATILAFLGFFLPNSRLKFDAEPSPVIKPIAIQIVVRGKAMLVAAFPRYPTP